jgi:hypothetical protein
LTQGSVSFEENILMSVAEVGLIRDIGATNAVSR